MCGRFALDATAEQVLEFLSVIRIEDFPPRFNIAPTQPILMAVGSPRGEPGSNLPNREALLVRWGFLPGWVKSPDDFPLLINARAETVNEKASFRAAMRHRRALVPVSGFYEWRRYPKGSKQKSQAYWIHPKNGGLVAFAGLQETWASADGSELDTGAIITCAANTAISKIHDRMPVVIKPEDFPRWLDCMNYEPRQVADLMVPTDDDFFEAVPISDLVNKVSNTSPEIQNRVEIAQPDPAPSDKSAGSGQMSLF
ncbi:SOS response-associated peptidase [Agrobacterium sp. ES01]|uniref:SOS response-associated peptidase n=1 Tax=Agrobacterium sp. ES01 TaxID=3420714 RepID=UPI003D11887F